jgi:quercetin dioxygenase-like cupin family protein
MPSTAPYAIAATETILDTTEARVTLMTLDPGQAVPRHRHSVVTDTIFCLSGLAEVVCRGPIQCRQLHPGDRASVAPDRVHQLRNPGTLPCRVLLIQGPGRYDFVPE